MFSVVVHAFLKLCNLMSLRATAVLALGITVVEISVDFDFTVVIVLLVGIPITNLVAHHLRHIHH